MTLLEGNEGNINRKVTIKDRNLEKLNVEGNAETKNEKKKKKNARIYLKNFNGLGN